MSVRPEKWRAGMHDDARAGHRLRGFEPVAFDHAPHAERGKARREAERRAPHRGGGSPRERADRLRVEVIVVIVRLQNEVDGRQARRARGPAATGARGPANRTGDARCENTGSVSTLRPPSWIRKLEWPIQVIRHSSRAARAPTGAGATAVGGMPRARNPERAVPRAFHGPREDAAEAVLDGAGPRIAESSARTAVRWRRDRWRVHSSAEYTGKKSRAGNSSVACRVTFR